MIWHPSISRMLCMFAEQNVQLEALAGVFCMQSAVWVISVSFV